MIIRQFITKICIKIAKKLCYCGFAFDHLEAAYKNEFTDEEEIPVELNESNLAEDIRTILHKYKRDMCTIHDSHLYITHECIKQDRLFPLLQEIYDSGRYSMLYDCENERALDTKKNMTQKESTFDRYMKNPEFKKLFEKEYRKVAKALKG